MSGDNSRFNYDEMASKVLRASRARPRGEAESALPASLKGKITVQDFGSRAEKSQTRIKDEDIQKKKEEAQKLHGIRTSLHREGFYNVRPTQQTYNAFRRLMTWADNNLGDVPHDHIVSAVKSMIEVVHNDELSEDDRLKELKMSFDSITEEQAYQIIQLAKAISLIDSSTEASLEQGAVAVSFDSDGEDAPLDELMEEDDDSSEKSLNGDFDDQDQELTIDPSSIDAYWLQHQLAAVVDKPVALEELAQNVFNVLNDISRTQTQKENDILELFDYSHFLLAKKLVANADVIVWMTKLKRSESEDERTLILQEIRARPDLFERLFRQDEQSNAMEIDSDEQYIPKIVDLSSLVFEDGSKIFMGSSASGYPEGTTVETPTRSYQQINVPAVERVSDSSPLVSIESLPEWAQPAFYGRTQTFNRIQSKVFPFGFGSNENMLVCAPTGAGKTNIALLAMLQTIATMRSESGTIDRKNLKIVYMAPLKALVQEQVREFGERLAPFGLNVAELTGDHNLTKAQISQTHLIVTTPEKWDIITRKQSDTSYTNLVRLVVIDEIHLLHDERGPVLESIVSRILRGARVFGMTDVRLVGLSATLPNYGDVANFLRVPPQGLFYFDASFRPCPLAQKFVGITEKKPYKRYQAMNSACYDKVLEYAGKHQVIIFVHSRKETARLARYLRDRALEEDLLGGFLSATSSKQLLESESVQNSDLADLLPTGFAIHHAGLSRADRASAEELFAEGHVQVLVSTATLAWGVNLPAHTVIINGTQVYNPAKGKFCELSPQDVLQMLGRAGRPKYDKSGEGIIITNQSEIDYYVSLINAKLPIESQLMSKLPDCLNAEIVLGNIKSRQEAVDWMGYTYLYVRMLQAPGLYQTSFNLEDDPSLIKTRTDLAHSALVILAGCNLIHYDAKSGAVASTNLGRIASHFYIAYDSMALYDKTIRRSSNIIDLMRLFAKSTEFKLVPVRPEEKDELSDLLERVPVPVKESVDDPVAKIIVLLQAYISSFKLDGFALSADMIYITQSAGRLFRAIYEIALQKGLAAVTRTVLDICKMVESQMWRTYCPLRQFPEVPKEVIRKIEAAHIPWVRYFELANAAEVGAALRAERYGSLVYQLLQQFPKFKLHASYRPITNSLLSVDLDIIPDFEWDRKVHGGAQSFLILVEDCDGEKILYADTLFLKHEYASEEFHWSFTVPIGEPVSPNYFVSIIAERWLGSESKIPISFQRLIVPPKFPANTVLVNMDAVPVSRVPQGQSIFPFNHFNEVQSQTFEALYRSDANSFIGCSYGNGRSVCMELALLRWAENRSSNANKAVYISPFPEMVDLRANEWRNVAEITNLSMVSLTGDVYTDNLVLRSADIVLCTVSQWNAISSKWRRRIAVRQVSLVIFDDMHMLGSTEGHVYESVIARTRIIASNHPEQYNVRLIGFSASLADGRNMGRWIDADSDAIFNFAPHVRSQSVEISLKSFAIPHHPSLMIELARYATEISALSTDPLIIFACDRRACVDCASAMMLRQQEQSSLEQHLLENIQDDDLRLCLEFGIGFMHSTMGQNDKTIVEGLFRRGNIRVLLLAKDVSRHNQLKASRVVVLGTQVYDGLEHRYLDYQVSEILPMLSAATDRFIVLTNVQKHAYYTKFLSESLPVESHLADGLDDLLMNEVAEGAVTGPQDAINWITYTFINRRIRVNPSYYGVTRVDEDGISEYLSTIVDQSLTSLASYGVIEYNDGSIKMEEEEEEEEEEEAEPTTTPLIPAQIASYYLVSAATINMFQSVASSKLNTKAILELLSSATEFEYIPIRTHEERTLRAIHQKLRYRLADDADFSSTMTKSFTLLQAHISRLALPPDLQCDLHFILGKVLPLVGALVDVFSGEGNLAAIRVIRISQSIVQAMWVDETPLRQIPYFDSSVIERCKKQDINTVYDFIDIEDDTLRDNILQVQNSSQMMEISTFVNKFPSIEIKCEVSSDVVAGETVNATVFLSRDDEDVDLSVECQFYPFPKTENWWLIVGDSARKEIYGMKRQPIGRQELEVNIPFAVPEPGHRRLTVWCMCDSYVDADQELEFNVDVKNAN